MKFNALYYGFLLLIPILLIPFYILCYRWIIKAQRTLATEDIWPKIVDPLNRKLRSRRYLLRLLVFFFLVIALTGPQWGWQWKELKSRGLEIIFALDSSKSMLATDIQPSRFERSKLAIKDLLGTLTGNRVGLIAFAGSSFLQCPLTLDYTAFAITLDDLDIQSIPRGGTAIGAAIATARQAFKSASGKRILILISDGENHEGEPVKEAQQAAKEGISIYTIGLGSPEGAFIQLIDQNGNNTLLKDESGNPVKTVLNEAILKSIATVSNGSYVKGDELSLGLEELYRTKLLTHYQAELSLKKQKQFIDRYQLPLLCALLLLLAELSTGLHYSSILKNIVKILPISKQG